MSDLQGCTSDSSVLHAAIMMSHQSANTIFFPAGFAFASRCFCILRAICLASQDGCTGRAAAPAPPLSLAALLTLVLLFPTPDVPGGASLERLSRSNALRPSPGFPLGLKPEPLTLPACLAAGGPLRCSPPFPAPVWSLLLTGLDG